MNTLASERTRLGIDQSDVAEKLGVSKTTISRWERGESIPTGEYLVKLHELFGCSIDYLLGLTDERKCMR